MARTAPNRSWGADRLGSAIGVAAVHLLVGYALVAGLRVALPGRIADDTLTVLELKPPAPELPAKQEPEARPPAKPGGGSASRPQATPPAAAPARAPAPPAPLLPPLIPAPTAPAGGSPAGSDVGGGGSGTGSGAGGGSGQGDGIGSGHGFTGARQTRGRFRNSDFPDSAKGAGRLRIGVRYAVGPSGRVDSCEIVQPSGYPEVDAMTCRVIIDRYRFRPARDDEGFPITEVLEEDYSWRLD